LAVYIIVSVMHGHTNFKCSSPTSFYNKKQWADFHQTSHDQEPNDTF